MNYIRIMIPVSLMIVCILGSGCIGYSPAENQTNNVSIYVTTSAPTITSLQIQSPSQANVTPWIIINPVSDHYTGDVFEINGTTNLGANEPLSYWISRMPARTRTSSHEDVTQGLVTILDQDYGSVGWSFVINTSAFRGGYYDVAVGTENMSISNWTLFVIID